MCRGTSVTRPLNMAFDKYDETRRLGLINLSICAPGFNLFKYNIA